MLTFSEGFEVLFQISAPVIIGAVLLSAVTGFPFGNTFGPDTTMRI